MEKRCRKCGSSKLNYECDMLEGVDKYAYYYRHLQDRKVYKCLSCGTVNDFKEPDY
jgi:hypothetical protein